MNNIEFYRGFFIVYNFYGKGEYTFQIEGDDVWHRSVEEAKADIDKYIESEY